MSALGFVFLGSALALLLTTVVDIVRSDLPAGLAWGRPSPWRWAALAVFFTTFVLSLWLS